MSDPYELEQRIGTLEYDLRMERNARDIQENRIARLERALDALLEDVAGSPHLAAEMARHELRVT